jgi:hypothetical protein
MTRESNAEMLRRHRAEARAKGICATCRARPAKLPCSSCQDCIDRTKASKAKLRKQGQCITCGERSTTVQCLRCMRERRERQLDLCLANGKCARCRRWPATRPGVRGGLCFSCKEGNRVRAQEMRAAQGRKYTRPGLVLACSICRETGHNRRTCTAAVKPVDVVTKRV